MQNDTVFTLHRFYEEHPTYADFLDFIGCSIVGRGIPRFHKIEEEASVFRAILKFSSIVINETAQTTEAQSFSRCHKNGWLQSESAPDGNIRYVLPSPLHAAYISWFLEPATVEINAQTPYELAVAVIKNFKPPQLSVGRQVGGTFHQGSDEARYQDEFYRTLHEYTEGCVRITPEFASAKLAPHPGRIDFFLPGKKWGIECTRDGLNSMAHHNRFELGGTYEAWLASGGMEDYILLDFRTEEVREAHPGELRLPG